MAKPFYVISSPDMSAGRVKLDGKVANENFECVLARLSLLP